MLSEGGKGARPKATAKCKVERALSQRQQHGQHKEGQGHAKAANQSGSGAQHVVVASKADRWLAQCAADVSLMAWVRRTDGASVPPWIFGIESIDLTLLPAPCDTPLGADGSTLDTWVAARLTLLRAQWRDRSAIMRLCKDVVPHVYLVADNQWHRAPYGLRADIARWQPILARLGGLTVKPYMDVVADMVACVDRANNETPTCVACMCDLPRIVVEPCGHLCLCRGDWRRLARDSPRGPKCPLCRSEIHAAWPIWTPHDHPREPSDSNNDDDTVDDRDSDRISAVFGPQTHGGAQPWQIQGFDFETASGPAPIAGLLMFLAAQDAARRMPARRASRYRETIHVGDSSDDDDDDHVDHDHDSGDNENRRDHNMDNNPFIRVDYPESPDAYLAGRPRQRGVLIGPDSGALRLDDIELVSHIARVPWGVALVALSAADGDVVGALRALA
jgi:hypothetical protein